MKTIGRTRWPRDQIRAMLLEQFQRLLAARYRHRAHPVSRARTRGAAASRCRHLRACAGPVSPPYWRSWLTAWVRIRSTTSTSRTSAFSASRPDDANDLYGAAGRAVRRAWRLRGGRDPERPGWEHFVRRFMEMGLKFYITGSNASLLSRELGSRLTGRYVPRRAVPLLVRSSSCASGATPCLT